MTRRLRQLWVCTMLLAAAGTALSAQQQRALDALTSAAQAGETAAITELATRYLNGDGTLQDYAQAAHWFMRAAQDGDPSAQNVLGQLLYEGLGLEQDVAASLRWLASAAETGNPEYLFDYAVVLETTEGFTDLTRAAALYDQAAQAGHLPAMVSLGVLYQNGIGVEQDFAKAKQLYERGVQVGHPRAQNNLGLLYVRGNGVEQDYARAAALFEAAASQGLRPAMANLGVLYENGFGVPVDVERADELYRMSGSGSQAAQSEKAGFTYDPRLAPVPNDAQALDLLSKAARADDPVAMFQLAWLLINRSDVPYANWGQAYQYFKKAAERGHGPSMSNLSLLYFKGLGAPQDYVLGHMWMLMAKRAGAPTPTQDALFAQSASPSQINQAQAKASSLLAEQGAVVSP